jgi:hypothetical protein
MLMRRCFLAEIIVALAFICAATVTAAEDASTVVPNTDYVWHWSNKCRNPRRIVAVVTLDDRTVDKSSITICHVKRIDIKSDETGSMHTFVLRDGARSIFGESIGARIEGSIWEAGTESESITLGVSASVKDRVLLNTLHSAAPTRESVSTLAQGLVIKTFPMTSPLKSKN